MPRPKSRIRIEGLVETKKLIDSLGDKARDLKPVFQGPIRRSIYRLFEKQFSTQGAATYRRWAPLKPKTQKWRDKEGRGPNPILDFTGELRRSLTEPGTYAYAHSTKTRHEQGAMLPYARYHQTGTKRMVRREIIPDPIPDYVVKSWDRYLSNYLMSAPDDS